jgi:hypothetical protein
MWKIFVKQDMLRCWNYKLHGSYFIWQVSFFNFLFYFFGFNLFDLKNKWQLVVFISITRLTNIHVIKWCSQLFLVSSDLINYCILRRFFSEEKVVYENIKVVGWKSKWLVVLRFWFFRVCFHITIFDFACLQWSCWRITFSYYWCY